MRILLLNQYFPPDTAATAKMAALVAESLAARHQVTVLAGRPSYDPPQRHPLYLFRHEKQGNLSIRRVGSTAFPRHYMRQRVSNYLSYLSLAVPYALTVPADVVLAMTDPPVAGIAGAWVARRRGVPFVYNIRDLYPEMAVGGDILPPSRWVEKWEKMHCRALRQAQRIIVLGEDVRERIVAKGVDPSRIAIVRDGALVPEELTAVDHPVAREIRCGFRFVLVHAGNLGFYGAWETLIKAARLLEAEGIGLVFVGDGAARGQVEAAAHGCHAVRFLPFRPSDEIPYVLAAGDLHVIAVRKELEGVIVPSKLYSILAAGRPVLAVTPEGSDVARIVRRSGCGVVADPDDPSSIVAVVSALHRDPARLAVMGQRAREVAREYDRARQLELFTQVIEEASACCITRARTGNR